jgi:hypothetical protein
MNLSLSRRCHCKTRHSPGRFSTMDEIIDIYSLQEPAYVVEICDVILDYFMRSSKEEGCRWYYVLEQVLLSSSQRRAD